MSMTPVAEMTEVELLLEAVNLSSVLDEDELAAVEDPAEMLAWSGLVARFVAVVAELERRRG
jgi:hypothetical protein